MKTILAIFLLTMAFGTAALAQDPVIDLYSAPKAEEIKEFVSESGKFKASFAGDPKTKLNPEQPGFAAYYLTRSGSNSSVTVNQFGADTAKQKDTIYKYVKDSLLKLPEATIISETDFQVGSYSGKEIAMTYDKGGYYTRVRVLPAGKKIFEIKIDVVNWHMMKENHKKEFEAEAQRFFDSFKLTDDKGKKPEKTN
jgi:hypothetical protein